MAAGRRRPPRSSRSGSRMLAKRRSSPPPARSGPARTGSWAGGRGAAMGQREVGAGRVGVPIVSGRPEGDPAAVVFDAVTAANARGNTTVIADTAGRLHTKGHLMDELGTIVRVTGRAREGAPDEVLLVLDGTAGQNAIQQARQFTKDANVTGLVVTKLDGTAKGGAIFAIVHELGLPVKFLGVGEKADDLVPMDPRAFVDALLPRQSAQSPAG